MPGRESLASRVWLLFPECCICGYSLRRRLERQAAHPSALATPAPLATPPSSSPQLNVSQEGPSLDTAELEAQLDSTDLENGSATTASLPDVRELDENIDTAFQLAMNRGPLCAEPVVGMAYFLESVDLDAAELEPLQGEKREMFVRRASLSDSNERIDSASTMDFRTRSAHLGSARRLQVWHARLVPQALAGHVLVRHSGNGRSAW